jgi:hypothetical protein
MKSLTSIVFAGRLGQQPPFSASATRTGSRPHATASARPPQWRARLDAGGTRVDKVCARGLGAAATALGLLWFTAVPAQAAVVMTLLGDHCGGSASSGAICVQLGERYDVSGGGVVAPAESKRGRYATPGARVSGGNPDSVRSFNVTSAIDDPVGASTAIVVSGLGGAFDFYWGSVDSHNRVDFFRDQSLVRTFTGADVAAAHPAGPLANDTGSFRFNQYVLFTGDFDRAVLGSGTSVAFEVATAAVPAPPIVALLGLGLLGLPLTRRRSRHV